jgi:HlyD family secretion protein
MNALTLPAEEAVITGDPRRDIRHGIAVALLFFVGLGGWATFARLDAAAVAPGMLEVSGQRQAVQHRDGGVVGTILVHEGQRVTRGQVLIRLAAAEVVAQERALASQAIRLLAQRARLDAEQTGMARATAPPEFTQLPANERAEAEQALRVQQAELVARRGTLAAQRAALGQRAAQATEQGRGFGTQVGAAREQLRLLDEQISSMRPAAERGFVSKNQMRELERTRAALVGAGGQYEAGLAQSREAAGESRTDALEAERTFRERTAADLRDLDVRLADVLPKLAAARDQRARTEIRAPATGAVVGLAIFTPGGVIAPGQRLMDIVPEGASLRVQAHISPDDADDLHVGQRATVKFPGLHDRGLPTLDGRLTRLSADAVSDEKTGASFFTAEVTVAPDELDQLRGADGHRITLRPGMPAQALIPLRPRTALEYAFEPLLGAFWTSLHEH